MFNLGTDEQWSQLFTQTAWSPDDRYTFRVGGDLDWRDARFIGSLPDSRSPTARPALRRRSFDSRAVGGRNGAFAEADWRALEDLRLIARRSHRLLELHARSYGRSASLGGVQARRRHAHRGGGEYHQVSDPLYFATGSAIPESARWARGSSCSARQIGEDRQMRWRASRCTTSVSRPRRAHARQGRRGRRHRRGARRRRLPASTRSGRSSRRGSRTATSTRAARIRTRASMRRRHSTLLIQ